MASTSKTMPSMDKKTGSSSSYQSRAFHWFRESHKAISNPSATGIAKNMKNDLVIKQEDDHIIINCYGDSPNKTSEDVFKYITEQMEKKSEEAKKTIAEANKGIWYGFKRLAFFTKIVFSIVAPIVVWDLITPASWWRPEENLMSTIFAVFFISGFLHLGYGIVEKRFEK